MSDLFFDARTPASGPSDMVGRPIPQFVVEFVAASPDRFRVQAGDLRDSLESAMPQTLGLASGDPAALLFIQPAQQQIELPMIFPFRMFTRPTGRTTTFVNRRLRCHRPAPSLKYPTAAYTTSPISRNRLWTGSYSLRY
jgi:hypothetical protein